MVSRLVLIGPDDQVGGETKAVRPDRGGSVCQYAAERYVQEVILSEAGDRYVAYVYAFNDIRNVPVFRG